MAADPTPPRLPDQKSDDDSSRVDGERLLEGQDLPRLSEISDLESQPLPVPQEPTP